MATTKEKTPAHHEEWTVLEHGKLEKLADNLWWTWGSLPRMSLKRSMVVARRADSSLVIHNAICLNEETMREIEDLGTPKHIIVPNAGHRLDAVAWKKRYPDAKFYGPKGGREAIEKVVRLNGGVYEDFPADDDIRFESLHGVNDMEGAMLVRSEDGVTVVLNDCMFNMDRKKDPLGFLFTTIMGSAPGPRVSRFAKLIYIKDKKALRRDLERFAEHPDLVRVIVAHEKVAKGKAASQALRQAATYL
jgi:hypothetical protein